MTARHFFTAAFSLFLAAGVWVYVEQLRYERSFYRRYLLEQGRYDLTDWWRSATAAELEQIRLWRERNAA